MLENAETPVYVKKVLQEGYPEIFINSTISQPLQSNAGVDAISGATRTSEGMIAAIEKGMYQIAENQLLIDVPSRSTWQVSWEDALVGIVIILAYILALKRKKKLRAWILIASVIIIGFITKTSLNLGNFTSLIMNKMPNITERPIWFFIVIGIAVSTIIVGKNIYCAWICPFGAVQEGIYKSLNLISVTLDKKIIIFAKKLRWPVIGVTVLIAVLCNNPSIAGYEPFSVFFGGEGTAAHWTIMGIVLLMSIFVLRFWCRLFCPVGTILDALAQLKRQTKRIFTKKTKEQALIKDSVRQGCPSCQACSTTCQQKNKEEKQSLTIFNKFVMVILVLMEVLIVLSVFLAQ